ncbi:ribosomal protein S18-alanine N-acetyltransferase [Leptothrix discophora]|uniref:[Ribosomal protein bS18]-alanine N-acetyltransferase n=1 Tax=Leptothrix discophora TaxID=89 RepID=A0ABT9G748_LEPDI|nr:ribosomal protein S18-alanine N-acetyltransferase [Leptothrix discophora]MDP4302309.1 ribosomal protein S18-alanine N-acetyltransferase [Leptothrix discophora]
MSARPAPAPAPQPARAPRAMPLVLRPITLDTLDALLAIEARCYSHPWSRGNFIDALAAGYLAQGLQTPSGELVAYMIAMAGVDEWHLLNITVAPEHQGRGHAVRLLHELTRHARATGCDCVWLEVRPSNVRAREVYARHGYVQVGLRRGYYPAGVGQREDALVLRLDIGTSRHERSEHEDGHGLV